MAELILEIVEGPGAGRQVDLTGPIEVGRDAGLGLSLADDELVSRRHARIAPQDSSAVAEDLGSRNGTFVNGHEIHAPTRVDPGDQVLIGVTLLQLRSTAQVRAQPTAVRAVPNAFATPPPPALATPERAPDYVPREALGQGPLDPLLDARTKSKARLAPIAIFVLAVIVVLIYLALR